MTIKEELKKAKESELKSSFIKETNEEAAFRRAQMLRKAMDKVDSISPDEIADPFDDCWNYINSHYKTQMKEHLDAYKNGPSFINPAFDQYFKLTPKTLCTVGAYFGSGKTTIGANIALSFIQQGRRALIYSNEEPRLTYVNRIATAANGIPYLDYRNGLVTPEQTHKVVSFIKDNRNLMSIIDYEASKGGTTRDCWLIESICKVARDVIEKKIDPVDVVIIDYLQNIESQFGNQESSYETLKKFAVELKNRANMFPFAVVVLAQMHSDDHRKGSSSDIKFIGGGPILQNSMVVVEVRADKKTSTSSFKMTKLRDGGYGEITLKFSNGKFISVVDALDVEEGSDDE